MSRTFPSDLEGIALRLFEGLATPVSLATAMLLKYGEYDQIAIRRIDPAHYLNAEDFAADNAAVSFLRKLEELPTTYDRKKVAVDSFFSCEKSCYVANERLSPLIYTPLQLCDDTVVADLVSVARKMIASTLGRPPTLVEGRFGPGATFGDRGKLTTVADKMSSRPTLTPLAIPHLF